MAPVSFSGSVDLAWLLICGFLVMLMQAGFCLLETGFARAKNGINVAIKNLVDFLISSLAFWGFGFALMYGASWHGLFGTTDFAPGEHYSPHALAALFFQLMFCSTATTIISGAVAERIRFRAYMVTALVTSAIVYPIFGHWAWGGVVDLTPGDYLPAFVAHPTGWLAKLGFFDFAGSTVVHSLGGWLSLALCLIIGPRIGRFKEGAPPMSPHNLPQSTIGAMMLWFGWFGFNGGSACGLGQSVPLVLLNTNLAAAAGGLAALCFAWLREHRPNVGHCINGVIGGLVGVTASCNIISPLEAILVGTVAGVVVVAGTYLLERLKIDDVVGAVPVHAFCGVWGTAAVALFGDMHMFPGFASRWHQLGVQLLGAGVCCAWAFAMAYGVLGVLNRFWSFRVEAEAEQRGLNVAEHGASTELLELLVNMDRHRRDGQFAKPVPVEPHTEVGQIAAEYNRVIERAQSEINAKEAAAEALRRAEEKYRSIFENAVEGMFQTSPDGRYLEANPALAKIYGYDSPADLIASLSDISAMLYVDPTRRDDFRHIVELDGTVVNFESEVRRRDGSTIWISENARAIRDVFGRVQFYEGTVVDVTARRVAAAMQAQVESAEAANRAKSEFLANMSHEIRTPLNGVMGMLELLGTTALDDRQTRFVRLARSSSDALLALINQILDFSKIEAGCVEIEHVEFRLRPLVEDLAEVLGHRAHTKGIELACRIHGDVPDLVAGDPERLRQVLVNLTNNAVKFTETGRVEIDVSYDDASDWRPRIRFEVRDTGIGVPANRRDRLFQPFSQVDASTTRKYGGTGLGLSICKQLVQRLGGDIEYLARPGGGSIFRFLLPLEIRAVPTDDVPRVIPPKWRDLKVLAVDDVDVNRELLDEHLRGWGLSLDTAPDAESALNMVRQAAKAGTPYQLVMLDRKLPDMDGLDLAHRIHAVADHADARLLLLTSLSESPARDELKRLGIADVLYKPLRQSSLFDALMNLTHVSEPTKAESQDAAPTAESAAPSVTAEVTAAVAQDAVRGGMSILIADDNEVNRLVAAEILRTAGHRSTLVTNGREAVDAAASGAFDLILMDCQMPVLDGFGAVAELRSREAAGESFGPHKPLAVVALTANAVRGDRDRCLAGGMNGYVTKPIDRTALLAEIERCGPETPAETLVAEATAAAATEAAEVAAANEALCVDELLNRCQGDRDFAGRLLEKFRKRLPQDLNELAAAAETGDAPRLAKAAHQLKGSAGNIGAVALHQRAAALEAIAEEQGTATDGLAVLRRDAEACLDRIEHLLYEFNALRDG